jgi:hypothetical protein
MELFFGGHSRLQRHAMFTIGTHVTEAGAVRVPLCHGLSQGTKSKAEDFADILARNKEGRAYPRFADNLLATAD